MDIASRYSQAKEKYQKIGVDTDKALQILQEVPVSMHCWQGDDVTGFDNDGPLTGGIQTTGNYPGKAKTPAELMADIDKVFALSPGKRKLNLHANYALFEDGEYADRDAILPKHFKGWVDFAKERGIGLDFNPTYFSHDMVKDNLTMSSPDKEVREFWIRHTQACIRISEYFAEELGQPCLLNIWIPDGYKDIPADRMAPRARFADSLDKSLAIDYDKEKCVVCLESKVFGIGMEAYTVGSSEFTVNYASSRGIISLMDNGHYHPTEVVSDKIPSMLLFNKKIALHITRPVRWDSDHVVLFDDETKEIAKEIIRCDAIDRVYIGLDFFDASINRVAAWVIGMRNMQKALLYGLLTPYKELAAMQDEGRFTEILMQQEELKTYPFSDIWDYYCEQQGVPVGEDWFKEVSQYEKDVMLKRS